MSKVDAQFYGNGGVLDFTDAIVTNDTPKLIHTDMVNSILIELTKGEAKYYIRLSERVVQVIQDMENFQRR